MNLDLIRLVDMTFSRVFSNPHCRYTGTTDVSGFNQIGRHWFLMLQQQKQEIYGVRFESQLSTLLISHGGFGREHLYNSFDD